MRLIRLLFCTFFFGISLIFAQTANAATPYMQGTARWSQMPGAVNYHVYYRKSDESTYTHSVVNISKDMREVLIRYLQPGIRYWYNVVAVDASGKELLWGGLKKLRVAWMP